MHLEVIDAQGRRQIDLATVTADVFRIGRREGNDLQLSGSEVSRDHAEIVRKDDDWLLRDRQSRYGTFVNGGQVTEHVLKPGDRIRLGRGGGAELVVADELGTNLGTSGTGGVNDLRQVAALFEGLRALGSGRILDEVLALVLDTAIEIARADRGFIMLGGDSGDLDFKLARGRDRHTLSDASFNTSRKIPEEVFRTGEARIVADLLDGDLANVHAGTVALGIRHVLCVPLNLVRYVDRPELGKSQAGNTRIGVLYLDSREKGDLLSSATRAALETLATEAAVAIENTRLYRQTLEKARTDQEIRIAAQIQQALLPQAGNTMPFCETAAAAVPCRSIGGDFFDWMERSDGSFAFMLGDVAGKGPPAALLSALMQGLFAAQASISEEPATAISRMNVALTRRGIESRYATVFAGQLSADGTLMTCNAGHNPPLLVSRNGVKRLAEGGTVVGLFGDAQYGAETSRLEDGDMLVIFSDGVSEALSMTEDEFGDDRLIQAVLGAGNTSAQHVVDQVLASLKAFTHGAMQSDDVTMVVVRYRKPAAS